MNMNEPVTSPAAVPQWTVADVRAAQEQGRHDLITAAHIGGQLRDVIASGALAQPASVSESVTSQPMDHAAAAAYLKAQGLA